MYMVQAHCAHWCLRKQSAKQHHQLPLAPLPMGEGAQPTWA